MEYDMRSVGGLEVWVKGAGESTHKHDADYRYWMKLGLLVYVNGWWYRKAR